MAASESPVLTASPHAAPVVQCAPLSRESQKVAGLPLLAVLALTIARPPDRRPGAARPPAPAVMPGSLNENGLLASTGSCATRHPARADGGTASARNATQHAN